MEIYAVYRIFLLWASSADLSEKQALLRTVAAPAFFSRGEARAFTCIDVYYKKYVIIGLRNFYRGNIWYRRSIMLECIDLAKNLKKKGSKNFNGSSGQRACQALKEKPKNTRSLLVILKAGEHRERVHWLTVLSILWIREALRFIRFKKENEEEAMRPFLWRFWTKTPARGRIPIFDRSWYNRVVKDRIDGQVNKEQLMNSYNEIVSFEEQLSVDGTLLIKFFSPYF